VKPRSGVLQSADFNNKGGLQAALIVEEPC
jgi:hypothetical protein